MLESRPLLGRTAGRVTLDDEKFGLGGVFLVAVGKLAGHPVALQRAFAAHKVAGLLGRGAGAGRLGRLFKDCLRNGGGFPQNIRSARGRQGRKPAS